MNKFNSQLKLVGYDLLGENGKDGLRFAWQYENRANLLESAAFVQKSKINGEKTKNISGYTSSVSSGCVLRPMGMACRFCRTGRVIPFGGMLTAQDIAKENVLMVLADMNCSEQPQLKNNAREFAYMGQLEPGYSYVQVRQAIKITDRVMEALEQKVHRHIVATSGVPEMIDAYIEDLKNNRFSSRVTMHFSLHATSMRDYIMPINKKYPYQQVLKHIDEIYGVSGEKPCVGIMLFNQYIPKGEIVDYSNNEEIMKKIAATLNPHTVRISLCEFNVSEDTGVSKFFDYDASKRLLDIFLNYGFEVKLFSSFGKEKNAACGLLGGKEPDFLIKHKWKELEKMAEELINEYSY